MILSGVCPRSSSLAVTSSGLSSDVSDAGLSSEKVMASGKNGDDGVKVNSGSGNWVAREVGESILLGMECPMAASCSGALSVLLILVHVIGLPERLGSHVFLEWSVISGYSYSGALSGMLLESD
ncbi:hypothetical protein Tco_0863799 [Tanacetum coccineum]